MARPIWKGHITFGLVNIPVTLYSAEQRTNLSFHMLDSRDKNRVRYERVNEATGEEVPWDAIVKGYEYDGGQYVIMRDEDFEKAAAEASKTVEIESFVNRQDIDPSYFEKPYYLEPGKQGEKGYALLRETLKRTGKIGVARVVIRNREHLAALMVRDNILMLELMRFDQELRKPEEFEAPGQDLDALKISDKEVKMAEQLVEAMTGEWKPDEFHDEYREKLMNWINDRITAGEIEAPSASRLAEVEGEDTSGKVVDMMALLKQSVESRGKAGGAATAEAKKTEKKPAKKSTPAKKRKTA